MLLRLLLLFTTVPLVELFLLISLARATNWGVAIGLALLTGIAGATLARRQGLDAWRRIHRDLAEGRMPATSLVDGVMILVAAVLLITPGLLTDLTGFLLLVPRARAWLRERLINWLKRRARFRFEVRGVGPAESPDQTIIDAEFTRQPDEPERLDEDGR